MRLIEFIRTVKTDLPIVIWKNVPTGGKSELTTRIGKYKFAYEDLGIDAFANNEVKAISIVRKEDNSILLDVEVI